MLILSREVIMNGDEKLFEQLKQLRPGSGNLNRDRLMYLAGKASVRPTRVWPWCAASGAMAALAATVLVLAMPLHSASPTKSNVDVVLMQHDELKPVEPTVDIAQIPLDKQSYWRLRQGIVNGDEPSDQTPTTSDPGQPIPSYRPMLDKLLNAS